MKRTALNVVMVVLVCALVGSIVFTAMSAQQSMASSSQSTVQASGGTPPEMPSSGNQGSSSQAENSAESSGSSTSNAQQPPSKPDGQESGAGQSNSTSSNEPPAKPEGESETQGQDQSSNSNSTNEPPEKPDGASQGSGNSGAEGSDQNSNAPQDQSNTQMPSSPQSTSTEVPAQYVALLSIEGALLGAVLALLFVSCFNKRKYSDVFKNKSNISVVVLSTLLACSLSGMGTTLALAKMTSNSSADQGGPGATSSQSVSYSAKKEITSDETITSGTFESTDADENAILATGNITASISGTAVKKSGDSDGGGCYELLWEQFRNPSKRWGYN